MSDDASKPDLVAALVADGWPEHRARTLVERAEKSAAEHESEVADELSVIVRELWALSGCDPRNP